MLLDQIQADLTESLKSHDEVKTSTLRMLISEINYARISKSEDLTDSDVITVVQKETKKRREAVKAYTDGQRPELALKEETEAEILSHYLPEQMSDEQLTKLVEDSINEIGATSIAQMGQVMGKVMAKVGQSAEPARVSALVKAKLS